jgi:acyl-CoA thioester hydrolase
MRISLQTRYNDYDPRGHVNNAVYFSFFEVGRMHAWIAVGGGADADFILADAHITYRSPAMLGEPLVLEVTTAELRTKAWVWSYRVLDARDDRLVAEGTTTQVMYDYAIRRTVPVPDVLREALAGL